jgi:hypothetical protein
MTSERKATTRVLGVILAVALANLGLNAVELPHIPLPDLLELPALPAWLKVVLGPGKLIALATILALTAAGEQHRRCATEAGERDHAVDSAPASEGAADA